MTITVFRGGKQLLHLSNCIIRNDGTVWLASGIPLIDKGSVAAKVLGKAEVERLVAAKEYDKLAGCFAKFGENESGLIIMDDDEQIKKIRAEAKAATTTAQFEHNEIEELFYSAELIAKGDSEDNIWLPCSIRRRAWNMLRAWREKYPAEARKEKARYLQDQADRNRKLASGALLYDADGWLESNAQEQRHDAFIAEAITLENQAKALETTTT